MSGPNCHVYHGLASLPLTRALTLQDAVAEARRLAADNPGESYEVRDVRGVMFNRYPDADNQWTDLQRRGLVLRDDE